MISGHGDLQYWQGPHLLVGTVDELVPYVWCIYTYERLGGAVTAHWLSVKIRDFSWQTVNNFASIIFVSTLAWD